MSFIFCPDKMQSTSRVSYILLAAHIVGSIENYIRQYILRGEFKISLCYRKKGMYIIQVGALVPGIYRVCCKLYG